MKIFEKIAPLQKEINELKSNNQTIGFVPTMGALHQGHLSLLKYATKACDCSIVSIFVNPTQFNDKRDLTHYPRTVTRDLQFLNQYNCDIVFIPSEEEMYPEPDNRVFDFDGLDKVMEGKHRPNHFNGVAQIVSRLFEIVMPDRAYFGMKDYQQYVIIKHLMRKYLPESDTEIISCPIVREADGLAMSSRNLHLSKEQRQAAPIIYNTLFEAIKSKNKATVQEVKQQVIDKINSHHLFRVEYFDIVDATTLQPVSKWNQTDNIVGCIAVFAGKIRLIDNIRFNEK